MTINAPAEAIIAALQHIAEELQQWPISAIVANPTDETLQWHIALECNGVPSGFIVTRRCTGQYRVEHYY